MHRSVHFTHCNRLDISYVEVQVDKGTALKVIGKDNTEILYNSSRGMEKCDICSKTLKETEGTEQEHSALNVKQNDGSLFSHDASGCMCVSFT